MVSGKPIRMIVIRVTGRLTQIKLSLLSLHLTETMRVIALTITNILSLMI